MEQRVYHGDLSPSDFGRTLTAQFNRGNLRAQLIGDEDEVVVQIATRELPTAGGETAVSVVLKKVEDGLVVQIGKQAWLGVAASLGKTAFSLWRNPLSILGRLDDIAQDIENLHLRDKVWDVVEDLVRTYGASFELSERLRRLICEYCNTANPTGEPSCIACGAPLGSVQPQTCKNCGYVVTSTESMCPNCGLPI